MGSKARQASYYLGVPPSLTLLRPRSTTTLTSNHIRADESEMWRGAMVYRTVALFPLLHCPEAKCGARKEYVRTSDSYRVQNIAGKMCLNCGLTMVERVERMMSCRKIHSLLMDGCPAALFLAAECFFHDLTSSDVVRSHAPTAERGWGTGGGGRFL